MGEPTGQMPAPPPPLVTNGKDAAPPPPAPKAPESDERLKELDAATKRFAHQQMSAKKKFEEEKAAFEKQKAETAQKEKEYQEWKQHHADRLRNPVKYLEKEYGPEWYDRLTQAKMSGVPTGDLIASEMDSRFDETKKLVQSETEALKKEIEKLRQQDTERAIAAFHAETIADVKRNIEKFPHLEAFWDDPSTHAAVTQEIDRDFRENQEAILAGERQMLTASEAASIVEGRIEALSKRFDDAKQKRQSATKSPPEQQTAQRSETPQRRTLSTDLTASSGTQRVPPKNDAERFALAKAAMENARRK